MTDFHDLIDTDGLTPEEEARLRRAHDLLMQAGPPPDLPPALEAPPTQPAEAEILQFPLLPKRRWALAVVAAATLVLIAFGGGYLVGHSKGKRSAFTTKHIVAMHGHGKALGQAVALLRLSTPDSVGNWPMKMQVSGLPVQKDRAAYYELWLTKNGKAIAPCGTFRVHGKQTTVIFTVPYKLRRYDGWIVTAQPHDEAQPGPIVLT
jgi:Anti-sigma-K factor rskA